MAGGVPDSGASRSQVPGSRCQWGPAPPACRRSPWTSPLVFPPAWGSPDLVRGQAFEPHCVLELACRLTSHVTRAGFAWIFRRWRGAPPPPAPLSPLSQNMSREERPPHPACVCINADSGRVSVAAALTPQDTGAGRAGGAAAALGPGAGSHDGGGAGAHRRALRRVQIAGAGCGM